jgi:hypothetical protein
MKMKTSELTGAALDWAVAKGEGIPADEIYISGHGKYQSLFRKNRDEDGNLDGSYTTGPGLLFSTKWETGGPIIEREKINLRTEDEDDGDEDWQWVADPHDAQDLVCRRYGPTPLVAAMRCYCCSKLGDEVEVPKELR